MAWRNNIFRVTVTLPLELRELIKEVAKKENRTVSNFVLVAVKEKLDRLGIKH